MMNVTKCPSTLSSYKEDAVKKNCSSWASETQGCHSFEYHCVLSDDFQYAIEVCAPSILIIGKILFLYVYILDHLRQIEYAICVKTHAMYSFSFTRRLTSPISLF